MDDFWTDAFTAVGLALTAIGAYIAARAVILKRDDAVKIGVPRWASEDPEKNLKLPMVQNLLASSKGAQRGLWLVATGTTLQIIPVVARLLGI